MHKIAVMAMWIAAADVTKIKPFAWIKLVFRGQSESSYSSSISAMIDSPSYVSSRTMEKVSFLTESRVDRKMTWHIRVPEKVKERSYNLRY